MEINRKITINRILSKVQSLTLNDQAIDFTFAPNDTFKNLLLFADLINLVRLSDYDDKTQTSKIDALYALIDAALKISKAYNSDGQITQKVELYISRSVYLQLNKKKEELESKAKQQAQADAQTALEDFLSN